MGAAGIAAAEAIRERDPGGEILPICEEFDGYYSRPGLAYYLTGEINERQVFPFSQGDFHRLKLHPIHTRVTSIDSPRHRVHLQDGRAISFDRLLIATGSSAAMRPLPGIKLSGVVKLDNLEDARGILRMARKRQPAVVVGGGITALEIVEGMVARGVKVHYLLRGDRYWRNVLDATESSIVEQRLLDHGVELHHQTDLAEI
jgi:NADPH-dependent 2,4-dienoyl-CoA reductase/sulfur reductase-like enzyme